MSLARSQQTIDQLQQSLTEERGRGSTLEEELNKQRGCGSTLEEKLNEALAELGKLKGKILELESSKVQLDMKIAELQNQLSKSVHNEGVWPQDKKAGVQDDEWVESIGSPLLTPVKNYWKTPVKSRSGRSLSQSGRSSDQSGRGVSGALSPIPFSMEETGPAHQLAGGGIKSGSPVLKNSVPESAPQDIKSILKELAASTPFHVEQEVKGWQVTPRNVDRSAMDQIQFYHSIFHSLTSSNRSLQEKVVQLSQEMSVSTCK